ncbi:hypothetical protein [Aeoliella mucimassa]|uniref:Uncharacterized protein n=1 Tax=Aeoliella mucimassa TaxID=2527972 RepID=A0A518AQK4_9BACT|nr:hypothetical protein [Aeoliella mucimassa]QDU57000.1 hypothetical protein Pan181_32120 [Aeoliella mucimassa]
MDKPNGPKQQLQALLIDLLGSGLRPDQVAELNELLLEHRELRQFYSDYLATHSCCDTS